MAGPYAEHSPVTHPLYRGLQGEIGPAAANAARRKDHRGRKRRDLLKTPTKRHPRQRGYGVINFPFRCKRRDRAKSQASRMAVTITKRRRNGAPIDIGCVGSIIPIPLLMRRGGPDFGVLKCLLLVRNAA